MPNTRVSTLELFFDLVFVFTITQLTDIVVHAHAAPDFTRAFLILTAIFWIYGGYAWLTNNISTALPLNRLLVLVGMAGFLVIALSTPQAFGRDGLAFGLAYMLVTLIHAVLHTHTLSRRSTRAILRIAPFNLSAAGLILLAAWVQGPLDWVFWTLAVVLQGIGPLVSNIGNISGFTINPTHFVERHGLVLIIALGESVVAIGVGVGQRPVSGLVILAVTLALTLIAALWWSYFDGDDERAEQVMLEAPPSRTAWLALTAYGYSFLVLLSGVVLIAAGLKGALSQLEHPDSPGPVSVLAAGVAVYLLGDGLFRRALKLGPGRTRWAALGAALLSLPLGLELGVLVQMGFLVLLLVGMLVWERRLRASS